MALTKVKAGNILLTTPSASSNDVTPATTAYVTTALANLADSAPSTLDTLNELAAALGDDANFSTTVTNSIALKAPLASPTFTGTLTASGLVYPTSDGTNGQVLTTDGAGNLSFADSAGGVDGIVSSADATAITIDSSENVGIGTSNPNSWSSYTDNAATVLQVQDTSQRARIVINGGNGAHLDLIDYAGSTDDKHLNFVVDGGIGKFGSLNDAGNSFITNNILTMDLGNGHVGIGTDPSATLDVKRDTNTANNLDSLGFDVAALIGNAGSNPGNHYTSGLRIYQGSGTVGSGLGVMHLGADNGTAVTADQYTALIAAPPGMTGGIKLSALDSTGTIRFLTGGNNERMKINSNGNVEVAEELILDSVGQSEWGMVKLDSQQLSGTYSQVEISISPSYSGYSVYKMIINKFRLAADGELWCNYMYGTTKKSGWYGGYSRAGEGNSTGQEGYSNQSECKIVGTNTTATQNNSYPFVGEFTFYPLEAGNRGKIVWRGIGRLSSGLTQSIFGAALTINTNAPDKIVFYSNQNISNFDYVLYGIKV